MYLSFDYANTFAPVASEILLGVAAVVVVSATVMGVILAIKFGWGWLRKVAH